MYGIYGFPKKNKHAAFTIVFASNTDGMPINTMLSQPKIDSKPVAIAMCIRS